MNYELWNITINVFELENERVHLKTSKTEYSKKEKEKKIKNGKKKLIKV